MFDMAAAADKAEEVLVEGASPESYLERFAWDEAKYPPHRPLKETVAAISETVSLLEDQLKVGGYYSYSRSHGDTYISDVAF